jgi:hypothetical protein
MGEIGDEKEGDRRGFWGRFVEVGIAPSFFFFVVIVQISQYMFKYRSILYLSKANIYIY